MKSPQQVISILAALFAAENPVSVAGKIVDLSDYVCIYADGQFSDRKLSIWFNPDTCTFIRKDESLWQGEFTGYCQYSFAKFVERIPEDEDHFQRWHAGIRKVAELMSK